MRRKDKLETITISTLQVLSEPNEALRHKSPISDEEIRSVIQLILDTRRYTAQTHPLWSFLISSPTFSFIKSIDRFSCVPRTRSWIRVPNIPPQALFYCIYDCATRLRFDKYYVRFEISRRIDPSLDVLISEVHAPVGVSNREFVEWRRTYFPSIGDAEENQKSIYAIELRSCDDSECCPKVVPASNRVERAEVWLSGYVFQWWLGDDGLIKGSELLVMSQVDWRGAIPKFIINNVTADGPSKWSESLIEAAAQICKDKKIDISMSNELLESKLGLRR